MKRARAALLLALILAACAKVHLTSWRGPENSSQPYKKILVCVFPKGADQALAVERSTVKAFASYPVAAEACLDVFPPPSQPNAEAIWNALHRQSFDAVLILERESIIRWSASNQPTEEENLPWFLKAYASGSKFDTGPIKMRVAVSQQQGGPWRHISGIYRLFDASRGQLVWKAKQAAKAPTLLTSERFAQDVAARNLEELSRDGLIPPAFVRR